jgi:hypothetical protein
LGVVNFKGLTGIVMGLIVLGLFSPTYGAQKTAKEYIVQGSAFLESNQLDKAIASFTDALKLSPKSVKALNGRGIAFVIKQDFDSAMADFNRAIKIDPKYGKAYYNRAIVFWCTWHSDKAEADMKKAQSLGVTVNKEDLSRFLESIRPLGKNSPTQATTLSGDANEKGQQAPESVKTYTLEERRGYEKKMALDIKDFKKKIKELVATWQGSREDRKQAIRKDIVALQKMTIRTQWKLRALKATSDKEWPYLKISVDSAMKDLISAFSEIESRYGQPRKPRP